MFFCDIRKMLYSKYIKYDVRNIWGVVYIFFIDKFST